ARLAVLAVDPHRVGAADAVRAGTPEGQRAVQIPLDLVQRVQDALLGIDLDLEVFPGRLRRDLRVEPADPEGGGDVGGVGEARLGLSGRTRLVQNRGSHQYLRSIGW